MLFNILRESSDFIFTPQFWMFDVCIALQIEYTRTFEGSRFPDHDSLSSETNTNQGEFSEQIYLIHAINIYKVNNPMSIYLAY